MTRQSNVGKKLLFERLTRVSKNEASDTLNYAQNLEALRESVLHELERLFNTRRNSLTSLLNGERTILEYGLASVETLLWQGFSVKDGLPVEIEQAIDAFEPRLKQVKALVTPIGSGIEEIQVIISGHLQLEHHSEPVRFPLKLTR